jgi:DNA mismatch endonuclease (patch repair protein)
VTAARYPTPSSAAASAVMRGNRGSDSAQELRVRAHLHRLGYRFRKNLAVEAGGLRVRPDIVFPRRRVAAFLDGCYWHRCPTHGTTPRSNAEYWSAKLEGNVKRDRVVDERLRAEGWTVIRIWEHVPPEDAADRIGAAVDRWGASG